MGKGWASQGTCWQECPRGPRAACALDALAPGKDSVKRRERLCTESNRATVLLSPGREAGLAPGYRGSAVPDICQEPLTCQVLSLLPQTLTYDIAVAVVPSFQTK